MIKPFAETYTMRSKFFRDLGEAAKQLADTYAYDTDLENRAAFRELVWEAVCHSLVEHHGFRLDELTGSKRPDPIELLAFIESGMSMTTEQIAERWPEWSKLSQAAYARYDRELAAYRAKWGYSAQGTSDPMVDSPQLAIKHWVHLPLIRAALDPRTPKES